MAGSRELVQVMRRLSGPSCGFVSCFLLRSLDISTLSLCTSVIVLPGNFVSVPRCISLCVSLSLLQVCVCVFGPPAQRGGAHLCVGACVCGCVCVHMYLVQNLPRGGALLLQQLLRTLSQQDSRSLWFLRSASCVQVRVRVIVQACLSVSCVLVVCGCSHGCACWFDCQSVEGCVRAPGEQTVKLVRGLTAALLTPPCQHYAGVSRFHSCAACCLALSVLVKAEEVGSRRPRRIAGVPETFCLGTTEKVYRFNTTQAVANVRLFLAACRQNSPAWRSLLTGGASTSGDYFTSLNASIRTLIDRVVHSAGGILQGSADGYLRLSLNRKLLVGSLTLYPKLEWSNVTLGQLQEAAPDQGDHLKGFPPEWNAQEASRLIFSRPDWALLISMYACLWSPIAAKGSAEALQGQLEAEGASGHLRARAAALSAMLGHSASPHALIADMSGTSPSASRGTQEQDDQSTGQSHRDRKRKRR